MRQIDDLAKPGLHEKKIIQAFKGRVAYEGSEPVFDTPLYLLGFSNRSGSNLLSEFLNSTPYFRGFREQLNWNMVVKTAKRQAIASFPDYIMESSAAARAQDRIYGYKASWAQIMMLLRFGIDRMYPEVRILHITRQDVLAQAVSYSIAFQSKQWTSKIRQAEAKPVFNQRQIHDFMQATLFSEQAIAWIASIREIPRHQITYEALMASPVEVMQGICRFSGYELLDWKPSEPKLKKQATELNRVFREQYMGQVCATLKIARRP